MSKTFNYNVIVIGAGSGGLVASYIAAAVKAKVALIEKDTMGGDCLNTGCVPSKALIASAKKLYDAKRSQDFGIKKMEAEFDFAEVMKRVQHVINTIAPHDSVERYTKLGVECLIGEATVTGSHEVTLAGEKITARAIIIATGAGPLLPPIPGLKDSNYITSDTLWELTELPKNLAVIGGGPIGVEMAQAFARLGSKVTVIESSNHILSREDDDVIRYVTTQFESENIRLLTGHKATKFDGNSLTAESENGKEVKIEFDKVLVVLGRKANVSGFGLEELGVKLRDNKTIDADPFLRTNIPSIFVCGDVTGPYQFTHTASHQAWYAAVNSLLAPFWKFKTDYSVIPWCTFTDPEVARVGLNEKEAKEKNIAYELTTYSLEGQDRLLAEGEAHGFIKVLTPPGKDTILGVTFVGHHAGDLIAEFIFAMKHGLGLNKILGTIHIYPTATEAVKTTAGNWKKAHAPGWALALAERFFRWRR